MANKWDLSEAGKAWQKEYQQGYRNKISTINIKTRFPAIEAHTAFSHRWRRVALPRHCRQPDRLHRRDARADECPRCAGADGAYDHAVPALRHAGSPKVSATA